MVLTDYVSAFQPGVPGFENPHWWEGWDFQANGSTESFSASDQSGEVARLRTQPGEEPAYAEYRDSRPLVNSVEICRFEVRADLHESGIGRAVMRQEADYYRGRDLFAFGDAAQVLAKDWLDQKPAF